MQSIIVVALGGNAILRQGQPGTAAEQRVNLQQSCRQLVRLLQQGHRLVITHGNGPQVGAILLQQEYGRAGGVPPMPLDVCGAQSQGLLGYLIQQALYNELVQANLEKNVVAVITQTVVDPRDPAFEAPTKPIGPFYTWEEAERLAAASGHRYVEDAGRGYRRVVPSPRPQSIVEAETIRELVRQGMVVVAVGGGGVPVMRMPDYTLAGVEAVIDKDLATGRLAIQLGADRLVILTDVPFVYRAYKTPRQHAVRRLSVAQAREWLREGEFPAGSMGPKVEACSDFVAATGRPAVITALEMVEAAVAGAAGTVFTP